MTDTAVGYEQTSLPEVPDLSGVTEDRPEPFEDGWYQGTFLETRTFTNKDGNELTFTSEDVEAQKTGRNIFLQTQITRKTDGRKLNTRVLVNYRPEDLTTTVLAAVAERKAQIKSEEEEDWGNLFRAFMSQVRIGTLQRIAGIRQFQKNGNGGLDISPLFTKTAFFRIGPQKDKPEYKDVKEFSDTAPKKKAVL